MSTPAPSVEVNRLEAHCGAVLQRANATDLHRPAHPPQNPAQSVQPCPFAPPTPARSNWRLTVPVLAAPILALVGAPTSSLVNALQQDCLGYPTCLETAHPPIGHKPSSARVPPASRSVHTQAGWSSTVETPRQGSTCAAMPRAGPPPHICLTRQSLLHAGRFAPPCQARPGARHGLGARAELDGIKPWPPRQQLQLPKKPREHFPHRWALTPQAG